MGKPNGLSEVGDDDSEEGMEDGRDRRDEFAGVWGIDEFVMVADRSRALTLA
jgi:hypothetical protein